jgi:hypothetical protein
VVAQVVQTAVGQELAIQVVQVVVGLVTQVVLFQLVLVEQQHKHQAEEQLVTETTTKLFSCWR